VWVRVLLWRFLILTTSAIGLTAFRLSKGYFFDSCALLFLFIGRLAEADIWRQIRTIVLGGEYVAPCHDVDFEGTRLFAFPSSSLFFFLSKHSTSMRCTRQGCQSQQQAQIVPNSNTRRGVSSGLFRRQGGVRVPTLDSPAFAAVPDRLAQN
jgi:hypothetical protein